MESLNASSACPYFLFNGQAILSYRSSMPCSVFSATCRMMECTIFPLLYRSSHLITSSGDTRRFDKSIYPIEICKPRPYYSHNVILIPFSLSTLSTTTTSLRPTRISFWILRIRLRESSDNRIMPSMLSYSKSFTYAPISAICDNVSVRSIPCNRMSQQCIPYLLHIHHDETIDLGIFLFVETAICQRHSGEVCAGCAGGWWRIRKCRFVALKSSNTNIVSCVVVSRIVVTVGVRKNVVLVEGQSHRLTVGSAKSHNLRATFLDAPDVLNPVPKIKDQ